MGSRIVAVAMLMGCLVSSAPLTITAQKAILVQVANGANYRAIQGARVFILGNNGRELAVTTTDAMGLAHLPLLSATEGAKYVLVEHPAFFITGMTWHPDQEEYYILATLLRVR